MFGASGQEELAKRLAELELSREFLSVLGDDQDWFDEDFGLSSRKFPLKKAEESAVLPKIEPPQVPPKPCEEPLAVPHAAGEVEALVHMAAEELWKFKELGQDLQGASLPSDMSDVPQDDDAEAISKHIYKQVQRCGLLFTSPTILTLDLCPCSKEKIDLWTSQNRADSLASSVPFMSWVWR